MRILLISNNLYTTINIFAYIKWLLGKNKISFSNNICYVTNDKPRIFTPFYDSLEVLFCGLINKQDKTTFFEYVVLDFNIVINLNPSQKLSFT